MVGWEFKTWTCQFEETVGKGRWCLFERLWVLKTPMIPVLLCVASAGVGFYLGSRTQTVTPQPELQVATANIRRGTDDSDRDEDDSEIYDGNLDAVEGIGPCKLVLVVRTDLNMTTGKIAAQYVHKFKAVTFVLMSSVVLKMRVSALQSSTTHFD
jgi:hypothetical protein